MTKYMKTHERYMLEAMKTTSDTSRLQKLLQYHNTQIIWLQHERLIHLLVFLFTAVLFISTLALMLLMTQPLTVVLSLLTGGLTVAYMLHYYTLENTVQRWYKLSNTLRNQIESTNPTA